MCRNILIALCLFGIISCKSMMFDVKDGRISKVCLKDVPVGYKVNATGKLYQTIDAGFQHWNDIFAHEIFVNVDETYNVFKWEPALIVVVDVVSHSKMPDAWNHRNRKWIRRYGQINKKVRNGCVTYANIIVTDLYVPDDLSKTQTIVRHEIGHMFSLKETIDFTSLMGPIGEYIQHPVDVSDEEIKALKCLYGVAKAPCDPTKIERNF